MAPGPQAIAAAVDALHGWLTTIADDGAIGAPQWMVPRASDDLLHASCRLRNLANRLDGLVTDTSRPAAAPDEISAFARQLERYSQDLRAVVQQRNAARGALQAARVEALDKLAAAAELKDNDTGEHVVRMGHFCAALARGTGAPREYCDRLLLASRMHDIGKIGIPDSILKKPGSLTEEEWAVMRTHPQIGAALLCDIDDPLFTLAAEVALTHHEKFDGSGYPQRLRGDAIPLSGRIVAVADFFDAVTMDRCYRPALTDEQAFALLRKGSGQHFDPAVIDVFFAIADELCDIRHRVNHDGMR